MRGPSRNLSGFLLLLLFLGFSSRATGDQGNSPLSVLGWPDGDAAAGREAFEDLKCYQCHRVPSDPTLAALNRASEGPDLVTSDIVRPRVLRLRQLVAPGSDEATQKSHMGSFAEVMTVRQLTDLLAYLEEIDRGDAH